MPFGAPVDGPRASYSGRWALPETGKACPSEFSHRISEHFAYPSMGLYLRNFARSPRGHIPYDRLAAWINVNVLDYVLLLARAAMLFQSLDLGGVRSREFGRER